MERKKHTGKHSDTEDMGALGSGKQFGVSGMGCVCVCVCVCEWHKTMLEADWGPCCPKKGINFILEALRSWKGLQQVK